MLCAVRILIFTLFFAQSAFADSVGVVLDSYADEADLAGRVDVELQAEADEKIHGHPKREFHFQGFVESGPRGDRSLEPRVFVLRHLVGRDMYFWVGRTHPLAEGPVQEKIESTGAIGSQWLQNQSNALTPTVVGWIGGGLQGRSDFVFWTFAATPFYFPSFGPRTELSEHADSTGSRYARLPPQFVRINDSLVPLRFKVDKGDIKDILLQPQALLALGVGTAERFARLSVWTSPTLDPEINTNEVLRVQGDDINVLVTAKPSFPRNKYLAFTAHDKNLPLAPKTELVYESRMRRFVVSQSLHPLDFLALGGLHTFEKPAPIKENGQESPLYANKLAWAEVTAVRGKIRPGVRVERHFAKAKEDLWIRLQAKYFATKNFEVLARADLLTGQDHAYFGVWRSLDSVSMGVSYLW